MGKAEKRYFKQLPSGDRIAIRVIRDGRYILEFSAQLEVSQDDGWTEIVRIDTCDEGPHRHMIHGDIEYRFPFPCNNLNEGFTLALKFLAVNNVRLSSNYHEQINKKKI